MDALDQSLVEQCTKYGYSYPGSPAALVSLLFGQLRAKDIEIHSSNAGRIGFLDELKRVLKAAPAELHADDPIKHAARVVEALIEARKEVQNHRAEGVDPALNLAEQIAGLNQNKRVAALTRDLSPLTVSDLTSEIHRCVTELHHRAVLAED